MASLTENKPLFISLIISAAVTFILAAGVAPDLSASLEITPFSEDVRSVETVFIHLFGHGK